MPGKARDISVGSEGSVYAIGWSKEKKGGNQVLKWNGKAWVRKSGQGFRIAVDNKGKPWVVTRRHKVFRKLEKGWERVKGSLDDIAIGPEGSVIGVRQKRGVWKYHAQKNKWYKIGKFGLNVSVGPGGQPFVTTRKGTIFWPESVCPSNDPVPVVSPPVEIVNFKEQSD